jgi:DNA-binding NarL/FixJ family response regulator
MTTILILEDIAETRTWLRQSAEKAFPGCEIREAATIREAAEVIARQPFDLAIVDLGLPDGGGSGIIGALSSSRPETTIVVATVMGDDASVVTALSNGAHGYLLKDSPQDVFVRQLKSIEQGLPALSPSIARRIMDHFHRTAVSDNEGEDLTPRERDVLGLIGRGLRNSEAARALGLSENTIASHIKSVYAKLGISTRAEAALLAARLGLT